MKNISERYVIKPAKNLMLLHAFLHIWILNRENVLWENSQFGYCPLVWFFGNRKINNRMNRIQERAPRIVYKDSVSTFAQLLEKNSSLPIHIRNLQVLATEIFKARNNLSPPIVQNIFRTTESVYNLRRGTIFESRRIQTQRYVVLNL